MLESYVHALLKSILGTYVDMNGVESEALKISVWQGKVELRDLKLQTKAFDPYLHSLPYELKCGSIGYFQLQVPLANLATMPISVHVKDVYLLFHSRSEQRTSRQNEEANDDEINPMRKAMAQVLRRKRASLEAMEQAKVMEEEAAKKQSQENSSTFLSSLITKTLDNVQVQIERVHIRIEDTMSYPMAPFAMGIQIEDIVIKSADANWNYTLKLRGASEADLSSCIRKKLQIVKFGVYWQCSLFQIPKSEYQSVSTFQNIMSIIFRSKHHQLCTKFDYFVQPMTITMKIIVNDRHVNLPLSQAEFNKRVIDRLGTSWMIQTINLIGDANWQHFVYQMPALTYERKYTISFVFTEAWSVAYEQCESDFDIPTLEQFENALCSCFQWSKSDAAKVSKSINDFRQAAVYVIQEKGMFLTISMRIDNVSINFHKDQYVNCMSLLSHISFRKKQIAYSHLRPHESVSENPGKWWKFAIKAILIDVREQLNQTNWGRIHYKKVQQREYVRLYKLLNSKKSSGSSTESITAKNDMMKFDTLEYEMDLQAILESRRIAKQEIVQEEVAQREKSKSTTKTLEPTSSSSSYSYLSYNYWFGSSKPTATTTTMPTTTTSIFASASTAPISSSKLSENDTKYFYDAIEYNPDQENNAGTNDNNEPPTSNSSNSIFQYRFEFEIEELNFHLLNSEFQLNHPPTSSRAFYPQSILKKFAQKSTKPKPRQSILSSRIETVILVILTSLTNEFDISLNIQDFEIHESNSNRNVQSFQHSLINRMSLDQIKQRYFAHHNNSKISGIRLEYCENPLPLFLMQLQLPPLGNGFVQTGKTTSNTKTSTHKSISAAAGIVAPTTATATISDSSNNNDNVDENADLKLIVIMQPLQVIVQVPFLLQIASFFTPPQNLDLNLDELDTIARQNARMFSKYSAAQLRQAIKQRTKLLLEIDVTSPTIQVIEYRHGPLNGIKELCVLTIYLGHMNARSHIQNSVTLHQNHESTLQAFTTKVPDSELYDYIEIDIQGIEILISSIQNTVRNTTTATMNGLEDRQTTFNVIENRIDTVDILLEKTNMEFTLKTSVAPLDSSIPLMVVLGHIPSVQLNISSLGYLLLLQMMESIKENTYVESNAAATSAPTNSKVHFSESTINSNDTNDAERSNLPKKEPVHVNIDIEKQAEGNAGNDTETPDALNPFLNEDSCIQYIKRVVFDGSFDIDIISIRFKDSVNNSPIIDTQICNIQTSAIVRSFDKRFEFTLDSIVIKDKFRKDNSYIVTSQPPPLPQVSERSSCSNTQETKHRESNTLLPSSHRLIQLAITLANTTERPVIANILDVSFDEKWANESTLWLTTLMTPIAIDIVFHSLYVVLHRDTIARLLRFIYLPYGTSSSSSPITAKKSAHKPNVAASLHYNTQRSLSSSNSVLNHSSSIYSPLSSSSHSLSNWTSTFLDSNRSSSQYLAEHSDDHAGSHENDPLVNSTEIQVQFQLNVQYLEFKLVYEEQDQDLTLFAMRKFYIYGSKSLSVFNIASSLQSVYVVDLRYPDHNRNIISNDLRAEQSCSDSTCKENSDANPVVVHSGNSDSMEFKSAKMDYDVLANSLQNIHAFENNMMTSSCQYFNWELNELPYAMKVDIYLKSPRICILYSFVQDLLQYLTTGPIINAIAEVWPLSSPSLSPSMNSSSVATLLDDEDVAHEADTKALTNTAASALYLPLLHFELRDSVILLPRHSISGELIKFQFDTLTISNQSKDLVDPFLLTLFHIDVTNSTLSSKVFVDNQVESYRLLSKTNFNMTLDFMNGIQFTSNSSTIQFNCSHTQYEFLTQVVVSNLQEPTRSMYATQTSTSTSYSLNTEHKVDCSKPIDIHLQLHEPSPSATTPAATNTTSAMPILHANTSSDSLHYTPGSNQAVIQFPEVVVELYSTKRRHQETTNVPMCRFDMKGIEIDLKWIGSFSENLKIVLDIQRMEMVDSRPNYDVHTLHRSIVLIKQDENGGAASTTNTAPNLKVSRSVAFHVEFTKGFQDGNWLEDKTSPPPLQMSHTSASIYERSSYSRQLHWTSVSHDSEFTRKFNSTSTLTDIALTITNLQIIPSNIVLDLLEFIQLSNHASASGNNSAIPTNIKSTTDYTDENATTNAATAAGTKTNTNAASAVRIVMECSNVVLHIVENPNVEESRSLMLTWNISIHGLYENSTDFNIQISVSNFTACSNIKHTLHKAVGPVSAVESNCIQPFQLDLTVHYKAVSDSLHTVLKTDRPVMIRFGYLDYITINKALHFLYPATATSPGDTTTTSGTNTASHHAINSENGDASSEIEMEMFQDKGVRSLRPVEYRENEYITYGSVIKLYAYSGAKSVNVINSKHKHALGFYNNSWSMAIHRKYLMLPPIPVGYEKGFEEISLTLMPSGNNASKKVGDIVCYGDAIMLQVDNKPILCHDQLGATGYLGIDGVGNVFECRAYGQGSTIFHCDRKPIQNLDIIEIERITINCPERHCTGGYLMYNGIGDAPVLFQIALATGSTGKDSGNKLPSSSKISVKTATSNDDIAVQKQRKSVHIVFPGINITIINDFNNMHLPLLHLQVSNVECTARGYTMATTSDLVEAGDHIITTTSNSATFVNEVDNRITKYTCIFKYGCNIQSYNYQLAIYEPLVEEFDFQLIFHYNGGIICTSCMYEGFNTSNTTSDNNTNNATRCQSTPKCLFVPESTKPFTDISKRAFEYKFRIYQDLIQRHHESSGAITTAKDYALDGSNYTGSPSGGKYMQQEIASNLNATESTCLITLDKGIHINITRNHLNVLLHCLHVFTTPIIDHNHAIGSVIYIHNISGLVLQYSAHNDNVHSNSREHYNKLSDECFEWIDLPYKSFIATNIIAHEVPAGRIMAPLRRLIWLRHESQPKPLLVPIAYGCTSYFQIVQGNDSNEHIVCETMAENGTLILKIRSSVKCINYLTIPVEVLYKNAETSTRFILQPNEFQYIPVQYLRNGTLSIVPLVLNGKLEACSAIDLAQEINTMLKKTMLVNKDHTHSNHSKSMHTQSTSRTLTFFWNEVPQYSTVNTSVKQSQFNIKPFQVFFVAMIKSRLNDIEFMLCAPVMLENALPHTIEYQILQQNEAWRGDDLKPALLEICTMDSLYSGKTQSVCVMDILYQESSASVALSVSVPSIGFTSTSRNSVNSTIVFGNGRQQYSHLKLFDHDNNFCVLYIETTPAITMDEAHMSVCPIKCSVYTQYWILDRTNLKLKYSPQLKTKERSVQPHSIIYRAHYHRQQQDREILNSTPTNYGSTTSAIPPATTATMQAPTRNAFFQTNSLTMLSFEPLQSHHVCFLSEHNDMLSLVEIPKLASNYIDISAIGTRGTFNIPSEVYASTEHQVKKRISKTLTQLTGLAASATTFTATAAPADYTDTNTTTNNKINQFAIGMRIDPLPGIFSRSKIVTLTSRYQFINWSTKYSIEVRQVSSNSMRTSTNSTRTSAITTTIIEPTKHSDFHWDHFDQRPLVQLRLTSTNSNRSCSKRTHWSDCFQISAIGDFILKLKVEKNSFHKFFPTCSLAQNSLCLNPLADMTEATNSCNNTAQVTSSTSAKCQCATMEDMLVHIAIQLHDPVLSILVRVREEVDYEDTEDEQEDQYYCNGASMTNTGNTAACQTSSFPIPYIIHNTSVKYQLKVWQKPEGTSPFEGSIEHVHPLSQLKYVPDRPIVNPTICIQVQSVPMLSLAQKRASSSKKISFQNNSIPQAMINIEMKLDKPQHLPVLELENHRKIWVELIVEGTTKHVYIKDVLPGTTEEHQHRRRMMYLKDWKTFVESVSMATNFIAQYEQTSRPMDKLLQWNSSANSTSTTTINDNTMHDISKSTSALNAATASNIVFTPNSERHYSITTATTTRVSSRDNSAKLPRTTTEIQTCNGPKWFLSVHILEVLYLNTLMSNYNDTFLNAYNPVVKYYFTTKVTDSILEKSIVKEISSQRLTQLPIWLPFCAESMNDLHQYTDDEFFQLYLHDDLKEIELCFEVYIQESIFKSTCIGSICLPLSSYLQAQRQQKGNNPNVLDIWCPITTTESSTTSSRTSNRCGNRSSANTNGPSMHLVLYHKQVDNEWRRWDELTFASDRFLLYQYFQNQMDQIVLLKDVFCQVLQCESLEIHSLQKYVLPPLLLGPKSVLTNQALQSTTLVNANTNPTLLPGTNAASSAPTVSDDYSSDYGSFSKQLDIDKLDAQKLAIIIVDIRNLQLPKRVVKQSQEQGNSEPIMYCAVEYDASTRCTTPVVAKIVNTTTIGTNDSTTSNGIETKGGLEFKESICDSRTTMRQDETRINTFNFQSSLSLGLDLIYNNGRIIIHTIHGDGQCGKYALRNEIQIGDIIYEVNHQSILNLSKLAAFKIIQDAKNSDKGSKEFQLTIGDNNRKTIQRAYIDFSNNTSTTNCNISSATTSNKYEVEYNHRLVFPPSVLQQPAASAEALQNSRSKNYVKLSVYLRDPSLDYSTSDFKTANVLPFLYMFGEDHMMDAMDFSKRHRQMDTCIAVGWVRIPTPSELLTSGNGHCIQLQSTVYEQICALHSTEGNYSTFTEYNAATATQSHDIVGQIRIAFKYDTELHHAMLQERGQNMLTMYTHIEMKEIGISFIHEDYVNSISSSKNKSATSGGNMSEVLYASVTGTLTNQPGFQFGFGYLKDRTQSFNVRIENLQIDNQLVDTNYPVFLTPVRSRNDSKRSTNTDIALLPSIQCMAVTKSAPNLIQFEYIFAQIQELEIKVEDFVIVTIAEIFTSVDWDILKMTNADMSSSSSNSTTSFTATINTTGPIVNHTDTITCTVSSTNDDLYDVLTNAGIILNLDVHDDMLEANKKVVLKWLLLCPIKLNFTFSSTSDKQLTLSMLSPTMSPLLRNIIGAAAMLVTNLDRAPIEIPEFYIENVFETKYALGFYIVQHYLQYGLRSWYKIVGSVDVLGNPIGLVSTLGAGVKDFFFTPAQMLLEDETGLRIENLRTGMTQGSKSLLRNTAIGIFHTTGKITETLGKGLSMLAMDTEYNAVRQQKALKHNSKIGHIGDGLYEGSKDLAGGIWQGVRGIVEKPVVGAVIDGPSGFFVGLGKGFAGLVIKPTAGVLDLLTSVSHGVKTTAESIDSLRYERQGSARIRLPRYFGSDGVLVPFSRREATASAIMLLTGLSLTDNYIYHIEYGELTYRGMVILTDSRVLCITAEKAHKIWEIANDSTVVVDRTGPQLSISQRVQSNPTTLTVNNNTSSNVKPSSSPNEVVETPTIALKKLFHIQCDNATAAMHFKVAIDNSLHQDINSIRYTILNAEQQLTRSDLQCYDEGGNGDDDHLLNQEYQTFQHQTSNTVASPHMMRHTDFLLKGITCDDLQTQPIRSIRVELCHLYNKDAHARVPARMMDLMFPFSVYRLIVGGGPYQWVLYRRYCEFQELHQLMRVQDLDIKNLPLLPPKNVLSTRDSVVKSRQEALSVYLQGILMNPSLIRSQVVMDFLTHDASDIRVGGANPFT